jgi:hypothetical protein
MGVSSGEELIKGTLIGVANYSTPSASVNPAHANSLARYHFAKIFEPRSFDLRRNSHAWRIKSMSMLPNAARTSYTGADFSSIRNVASDRHCYAAVTFNFLGQSRQALFISCPQSHLGAGLRSGRRHRAPTPPEAPVTIATGFATISRDSEDSPWPIRVGMTCSDWL